MVEVSLTVGKLDASLALLLTKEHHLIEFPTVLLPDGVTAGSVVTIKCEQDHSLEQQEAEEFEAVQDEILNLFGTHEPKHPNLRVKNVTQTSAVLEWDPLELGSASIKALTLYKNGERLGQVPNPLVSTTTKLSGLPVDTAYEFHLRLATTAGVYESEKVKLKTHKMTDLSGITVCLGDIDPTEGIKREDIETSLKNIGARPLQTEVAVDTTHFVSTIGLGAQWKKAVDNNIPVVRPEWLKACEKERRIVGVRNFYLDADPKFLQGHKFTKEAPAPEPVPAASTTEEAAPAAPEAPTTDSEPAESEQKETPAAQETHDETTTEEPITETPVEEQTSEVPVVEEPAPAVIKTNEEAPQADEAPLEDVPIEDTTPVLTPEEPRAAEEDVRPVDVDIPALDTPVEDVQTQADGTEPVTIEATVEEPVSAEEKAAENTLADAPAEETKVEETEKEAVTEPVPEPIATEEEKGEENNNETDLGAAKSETAEDNEEEDAEEDGAEDGDEADAGATSPPASDKPAGQKKKKKNNKKKGKKK